MKASQLFVQTSAKGVSVLTGKGHNRFCILGSSLPISFNDRGSGISVDQLNSVSVDLNQNVEGVMAVIIHYSQNGGKVFRNAAFLLPIRKGESAGYIDLDSEFVSKVDAMGQIVCAGGYRDTPSSRFFLNVTVYNELFTTDRDDKTRCFVSDADLLCRFIVGRAKPKEVRAVAREVVEEASALKNLQEECDFLSDRLKEAQVEAQELKRKSDEASEKLRKQEAEIQKQRSVEIHLVTHLEHLTDAAKDYLGSQWTRWILSKFKGKRWNLSQEISFADEIAKEDRERLDLSCKS